jgi:heme O synthase-like polyprenyltransferase
MTEADARPAFYALAPGGWRDYVTLLHLPYTAWHLSYVVIGGCLASSVAWGRLGATVAAFALALGVGAHALDELNGRPLRTRIPRGMLVALAISSVAAACVIGLVVLVPFRPWLTALIPVGVFLVLAYNLELWEGRLHTDLWFGLAWGAFPLLCGFAAVEGGFDVSALVAAAFATLLSLAQRELSAHVRHLRRDVRRARGELELTTGSVEELDAGALISPAETALRLLTAATVMLAAALVVLRL